MLRRRSCTSIDAEEQIGTLIELAKNKCKISWSKEETNEQITGIVEDAVPVIVHLLGIKEKDESDLLSPGLTRGIIFGILPVSLEQPGK